MSQSTQPPSSPSLFTEKRADRTFPSAAVAIAVAALAILAAVIFLMGKRGGAAAQNASYAPNVLLGDVKMSESESLSGGKSTYLDGRLSNNGPLTVTGVTVRVSFPTDSGTAPQTMTVPVQLIRSREPYIDVVPVSAAPVPPSAGADFRLIFEGVTEAWNQQPPSIQVTGVSTR